MNRFSQTIFLEKTYHNFLNYIHQISNFLNEEPYESQTNLNQGIKTGLLYATWYHTDINGNEYETCFSFLIPDEESPYWAVSIHESDTGHAGVDEEIVINTDPLPIVKKLLLEYNENHVSKPETNLSDIVKQKIQQINEKTDSDTKLNLYDLIKQVKNEKEQKELMELFKKKTLKAFNITQGLIKLAKVVKRKDGYYVLSRKGRNLGGPYSTEEEALKRLRQVEYFKFRNASKIFAQILKDEQEANHFATLIVAGFEFLLKHPELANDIGVESTEDMVEYALSHAITESDTYELSATSQEDKLFHSLIDILEKHNGKIFTILPDVKNAVRDILLKNTEYNIHDYDEKGEINSSIKALMKLVENINSNTTKDNLLDIHSSIKTLPESSEKTMLMQMFLNKTKVHASKNNRFTKVAQTATYYENLLSKIKKFKFSNDPHEDYKKLLDEISKVEDPDLRKFYQIQLNKVIR